MSFLKTLFAAALLLPVAACGDVVITKPQYATPAQVTQNTPLSILYLECGNANSTARAVSMLTLAQLNDPDRTVRFSKGLPRTCRAGNVTSRGYLEGSYLAVTRDGWTVRVVDWVQSNGFPITFVDTAGASLGRTYRRPYDSAVPRRYDNSQRPLQQHRSQNRLTEKELLMQQVERERRRLKKLQ